MKAAKGAIGRAVDQPDPKVRFYLFLGPDMAQSRGLAGRLLQTLGAAKLGLAASDLKSNPALLADEASALSLFGEKRLIWIEPAGNEIVEAVEALLAVPSIETPAVAIAGTLTKGSPLLKLAEAESTALAFTAYPPEGQDAARLVVDLGKRVGLKIDPPVASRIADSCGNDQALIERELEKIALYVDASPQSPKEAGHDALDAVGAGDAENDLFGLADFALAGDLAAVAEAIAGLPSDAADAIPVVRALQRRLLMLAPLRARIERGEKADAVMTSVGKALFWKDKDKVGKMLRQWTAEDLSTVAARAGALERELLFSDAPEREALEQELFAICRKARSAR